MISIEMQRTPPFLALLRPASDYEKRTIAYETRRQFLLLEIFVSNISYCLLNLFIYQVDVYEIVPFMFEFTYCQSSIILKKKICNKNVETLVLILPQTISTFL